MQQKKLAVLAVVGTVVMALVLVGGAAARQAVSGSTLTLSFNPPSGNLGDQVTASGQLVTDGSPGPANQAVQISSYNDSECTVSGSFHDSLLTDSAGNYSNVYTVGDSSGTFYFKAESGDAVSDCVAFTVGSEDNSGDNGSGETGGGSEDTGGGGAILAPAARATSSGPDRYGYCSVVGNTWQDGSPISPGTFLNLLGGQPDTDSHYTGATPAFWVEGLGITCDPQAMAAGAPVKVDHLGNTNGENGPLFYTFVPKA
jgi:hypothetical protein